MADKRLWTRNELLLAINLYCKTPFGRLHRSNPDVIALAGFLNRTPSSLAWKLVNFASLDPSLHARGIKGAENVSKLDKEIWNEFYNNWDALAFESEMLLYDATDTKIFGSDSTFRLGEEKERFVKTRTNQFFFRATLVAAYDGKCCITGISNSDLLIASHIVLWSIDSDNRLNPHNGMLINALHDKAFEHGYITVTTDYKILVCKEVLQSTNQADVDYFHKYHTRSMILPSRFLPDVQFIKYHNEVKFRH